jgi:hypothetical protein
MSTVDCPSCGCKLRATTDLQGAMVQCPRCGTTFTTPAPAPAALPFDEDVELVEFDDAPLGPPIHGLPPAPRPLRPVLLSSSTSDDADFPPAPSANHWRSCPVCGHRGSGNAPTCSICGTPANEGDARPHFPTRRDYEPHRGPLITTLGGLSALCGAPGLIAICFWPFVIPSLLALGLGSAALVMSRHDLDLMERNIMDPDGRTALESGRAWASVGTVLGLIGVTLGGLVRLMAWFADPW